MTSSDADRRAAPLLEAILNLADRWTTVDPASRTALSPYEGADDLNGEAAIALDGALFLDGEGRPAELAARSSPSCAPTPRASRRAASGWPPPCRLHDNERRWRVFRGRVEQVTAGLTEAVAQ